MKTSSWNNLKLFDELSGKQTMIHQRHPMAKLLTTLVFIITVVSFDKYQITGLLPFVWYPVILIILGDLPAGALFKRVLVAVPFALGIGVFNPIFDQSPMLVLGNITISGGWVSFASILMRFCLTVLGALLLIATTGMGEVAGALLKLKLPRVFVIQLLFMYRYISVLMEETGRVMRAHTLRSLRDRGVHYQVWGSLLGQLLLRTIDRAQRIYQAMLCRGFTGEFPMLRTGKICLRDIIYVGGWSAFFVLSRFFNIPEIIGSLILGG